MATWNLIWECYQIFFCWQKLFQKDEKHPVNTTDLEILLYHCQVAAISYPRTKMFKKAIHSKVKTKQGDNIESKATPTVVCANDSLHSLPIQDSSDPKMTNATSPHENAVTNVMLFRQISNIFAGQKCSNYLWFFNFFLFFVFYIILMANVCLIMNWVIFVGERFWVTKLILWLCFRPLLPKKFFFFEKPRNFMFFMCFGPRRSFYEKTSGVWRPASGVLRTKLGRKKFQSQMV